MAYTQSIPKDLKYLILHESPGEVKTIKPFLPKGYMALATIWHFMTSSNKELDVDESTWTLRTFVDPSKKDVVKNIQQAIDVVKSNNGKVIIATDPDREWESIAHSILEHFKLKKGDYIVHPSPASLVEKEYMKGINNPNPDINRPLAEAGITRRILDKYVGFKVTEHLWSTSNAYKPYLTDIETHISDKVFQFEQKNADLISTNKNLQKIVESYKDLDFKSLDDFENRKGISFWRVQSVSLILLVIKELEKFEKELERKVNILAKDANQYSWEYSKNDELETQVFVMREIYDKIQDAHKKGTIKKVSVIDYSSQIRKVNPPETLDTLKAQTSIGWQFGYGIKKIMDILQRTYEAWFTTYMRTDTNAVSEAYKEYIQEMLVEFWDNAPFVDREYKAKGEHVQDWHIGILPTGTYDFNNIEKVVGKKLSNEECKVFEYVVRRSVAAFMEPALIEFWQYTIEVEGPDWKELFILKDTIIQDPGFLSVFTYALEKYEQKVFYKKGDTIGIEEYIFREKDIKLPGGYTETGFVKELESHGIWRPSTWKDIVETLKDKKYITVKKDKIEVTPKGFWVYQVLVSKNSNFWGFRDIQYTATMENILDSIVQRKSSKNEVMESVKKEIDSFYKALPTKTSSGGASLWTCPSCKKGEIVENAKAWGCNNWKNGCKFTIWKEVAGHKITEQERDYMIENKESEELEFISKAGKPFQTKLVFDKKSGFKFNF